MPSITTFNTSILGSPVEAADMTSGSLSVEKLHSIEEVEVTARHILENRVTGENDALYDLLETNEKELSEKLDDYFSLKILFNEYSDQKRKVHHLKESLKGKKAKLEAYEAAFTQYKKKQGRTDYFDVQFDTYKRLESRYFSRGYRPVICPYYVQSERDLNEAIASGEQIDYQISQELRDKGYIARVRTSRPNSKMKVARAYLAGGKIMWEKEGDPNPSTIKSHRVPHPSFIKYHTRVSYDKECRDTLAKHLQGCIAAHSELKDARQKLYQIEGSIFKRGIKISDYNLSLSQEKLLDAADRTETTLDLFTYPKP